MSVTTVLDTIPYQMAGKGASQAPGVMPSGIYFGLDESIYHRAFALSASGIKNMRISSLDFWARCSALNPDYEDEDTDALRTGRAYDRRIVEGKEAFDRYYAPAVDPADHPRVLRTAEDIKVELRARELPVSGTKDVLIKRLCDDQPTARRVIWDCIVEDHEAQHVGKELLPPELIHKIEVAAAMIEKHPQLGKAFSGGYPQVSIFWVDRESGVPCKARLDYLKPKAIVDLKTFENTIGLPIDKAVARAVANQRYHIQAALYLEAVREARRMLHEPGHVFGEVDDGFLRALAAAEEQTFLFVWQQKGIAPLARGKVLAPGTVLDIGRLEIDRAKALFAKCWETYGTDPWMDVADVSTFDDTDFPAYIAD